MLGRCARGAEESADAVGDDVEGVGVEEPRNLGLVLLDLLEGLPGLILPRERDLGLDHYERDPIHEDHKVRDPRPSCLALHLELVDYREGVVLGVEDVDQVDHLIRELGKVTPGCRCYAVGGPAFFDGAANHKS